MKHRNLEVVLATCNGERHLEAQLQSLNWQKLRPDHVLVFDDRSSDGTGAILQRWAERHPGWVQLLPTCPRRLGPREAFNHLLQHSTAAYVALCDQDDLWLPQRLSVGMTLLQEETLRRGGPVPLLLHSNAELIDIEGNTLNSTLWSWHGVSERPPTLLSLGLRNQVSGCTVLLNRTLLDQALPIPEEAVMHDHWLALIALQLGGLISCPTPLIRHRRHNSNASGPAGRLRTRMKRNLQKLSQLNALRRRTSHRAG